MLVREAQDPKRTDIKRLSGIMCDMSSDGQLLGYIVLKGSSIVISI